MRSRLLLGDSAEILKTLGENSVDSLVTDPPAGISLMSAGWDGSRGGRDSWVAWLSEIFAECLRVLKPGAHGLVWALPRRSHWTALALEDSGFEIRDVVTHIFGTGFPKSQDLGDGWGTSLKPSSEGWLLVRKPPSEGTLILNRQHWGTGGLNIEANRVGGTRFPTNVLCSHSPRCTLQGVEKVRAISGGNSCAVQKNVFGTFGDRGKGEPCGYGDEDGMETVESWACEKGCPVLLLNQGKKDSSRFFQSFGDFVYAAKASTKERGPDNKHPTVKSLALMTFLVKLVTPYRGLVLDPFAGSGSTGVAAIREGYRFVGVEQDPEYHGVALGRLAEAGGLAQKIRS